jgi:hypothetical protein
LGAAKTHRGKGDPMKKLVFIYAVILALAFAHEGLSAGAPVPQIWLSLGGQGQPPESNKSWYVLFYQPDAPWPEFMNHVQVVGMLTQVLEKISDANLAKIVARLREKHIALGVEMLAQAYTLPGVDAPPGCGGGVEGYAAPAETAAIAAKLKRAGATLQYIAMDEPLWFGHYYNEKNACHSSIDNVVARVAANMREYQKVFPDVIIGDGEPFPSITAQPHWQNDYRQWLQTFKAVIGKPLSFTAVDINWGHKEWPESVRAFANFARDVHMPIGMIYNAAPPNKTMTNEEWLNDAERNTTYIERTLGIVPSWAVFSSWVKFPGRVLSVDNALGEDELVKRYLRLHGVK